MNNHNTYYIFTEGCVCSADGFAEMAAYSRDAFMHAFELDSSNPDHVKAAQSWSNDYVVVTFNSPIDADTMQELCDAVNWSYHVDSNELHQEISDMFDTDVTIVYPSERLAAH